MRAPLLALPLDLARAAAPLPPWLPLAPARQAGSAATPHPARPRPYREAPARRQTAQAPHPHATGEAVNSPLDPAAIQLAGAPPRAPDLALPAGNLDVNHHITAPHVACRGRTVTTIVEDAPRGPPLAIEKDIQDQRATTRAGRGRTPLVLENDRASAREERHLAEWCRFDWSRLGRAVGRERLATRP